MTHCGLASCPPSRPIRSRACGVHHGHYAAGLIPSLSVWALISVVLAGMIFGLIGMLFATSAHALSARMKAWIGFAPLRPLAGGLVLAAAVWFGDGWRYVGLGLPAMTESFQQAVPAWDFAAKLLSTVWSLGSSFKGGEVTPLFFIGSTLGNTLAPLLHQPIGFMAALGFVAVFAGAANTPLACTLMAMELFGAPIGIFAAVACVVSYLFSGHTGIYKAQRIEQAKHQPRG